MTRPRIEPQSPGPLANTLPIRPMVRLINNVMKTIYLYGWNKSFISKFFRRDQQQQTPSGT